MPPKDHIFLPHPSSSTDGPNLYVHDILSHVIQILNDEKMVVWLCNDYTQVLVQHIFTVPRYVMEITHHMWDGEFTEGMLQKFTEGILQKFTEGML